MPEIMTNHPLTSRQGVEVLSTECHEVPSIGAGGDCQRIVTSFRIRLTRKLTLNKILDLFEINDEFYYGLFDKPEKDRNGPGYLATLQRYGEYVTPDRATAKAQ